MTLPRQDRFEEVRQSSGRIRCISRIVFSPLALGLFLVFVGRSYSVAGFVEAAAQFRTGEYAACAAEAEKGIAADEFSENLRLIKIRAEMEQGKYEEALRTLDAALEKLPRSIQLRWIGRDVCRFNNQLDRVAKLEGELTTLLREAPWRYSDAVNRITVAKFLLSQNVDPKRVLEGIFNEVKKQQPGLALVWSASGELALDKQDYALAAQNFSQAVKLDPADADAHFGLARSYATGDSAVATAALKEVLARNPNHVGALLFLVENQIDSERYEDADNTLKMVAAVNPHHPRLAACRAVLAHLRGDAVAEQKERQSALKFWPTNPEPYYLLGKKLSQKYRFREGAQYQREALKLDSQYLPSQIQLAQDLLRLGEEEEGWRLADAVHKADEYSVLAHNLSVLQESLAKFRTLERDGFLLRMDSNEAAIFGERVLALLSRAKKTLCDKYHVELPGPIIVEMFPRQEDFAIRTFGLPGGAGFLGVCFGTVITANSPASQGARPSCWESTLWHEFCHVVTLNKTRNRMPRWLSEGISVYEERQADSSWGQTIKPTYRKMLLGDELTPVSRLSGAFLEPASPQHLQFAYFESSLVVEYLVANFGVETLQKILDDLGAGVVINDALARHTMPIEQLDSAFAAFARDQANAMAPEVDWADPELPRRADEELVVDYLKDHPHNYAVLQRLARIRITRKNWNGALETLGQMRLLYPRDAAVDSLYPMLAAVHRELKDTNAEREALVALAQMDDDAVEVFSRLVELAAAAGDWGQALEYTRRWLAVTPLQAEPHRRCAAAALKMGDDRQVIECEQALLRLSPVTAAESHFQLAAAFDRLGEYRLARQHVLYALEEAPRYRAAQKLLLGITAKISATATGAEHPQQEQPGPGNDSSRPKPEGF